MPTEKIGGRGRQRLRNEIRGFTATGWSTLRIDKDGLRILGKPFVLQKG